MAAGARGPGLGAERMTHPLGRCFARSAGALLGRCFSPGHKNLPLASSSECVLRGGGAHGDLEWALFGQMLSRSEFLFLHLKNGVIAFAPFSSFINVC